MSIGFCRWFQWPNCIGFPRHSIDISVCLGYKVQFIRWKMETVMSLKVKCPHCRKEIEWIGNPFRPFCSERCKMIDLGAWANEEYRVPGEPPPSDEEDE